MLKNESQQKFGLGTGLGAYPNSFFRIWILIGFVYWGIPFFIYFLFAIIIISILAMFLPLAFIIEMLG